MYWWLPVALLLLSAAALAAAARASRAKRASLFWAAVDLYVDGREKLGAARRLLLEQAAAAPPAIAAQFFGGRAFPYVFTPTGAAHLLAAEPPGALWPAAFFWRQEGGPQGKEDLARLLERRGLGPAFAVEGVLVRAGERPSCFRLEVDAGRGAFALQGAPPSTAAKKKMRLGSAELDLMLRELLVLDDAPARASKQRARTG